MKIINTKISGLKIIQSKNYYDPRGYFREVFKNNGNCYLINHPIVNNLAKKILIIVKNLELIKKKNGTKLTFDNYFNSNKQSEKFKDIILNI